jgi:cytoskeleton protein RodZ
MTLGETLRAAREEARRSVEDLSRATRIRGQLIRGIESDDFSACGGTVYARGHVRSLATALGLDPEPLVAEFDAAHAVAAPAPREIFEREVLAIPDRKGPNWTAAMAVAAALALVVAVIAVLNPGNGANPVAADNAGLDSATPSPSAPAVDVSTSPAQPTARPTDLTAALGVTLRITITGDKSWVSVRDGGAQGRPLMQATMSRGESRDFTAAKELYVVFGNAGAVTVNVNGRDLGSPGAVGQVVRTSFLPGDPTSG